MPTNHEKRTKPIYRRRGCLISVFILALIVFVGWQIGEPGRRAKKVHQAIRPGMSFGEVEELLTGRHYCFFQVKTDKQWQIFSRDDFAGLIADTSGNASSSVRLQLHFMGMAPGRVSFFVELDHRGNVTNVTKPYGWD